MVVAPLLLSLASILTWACANPALRNLVVLDRRDNVPEGFVKNGAAAAATVLDLRIALVPNNIAGLEKALFDVSTPSSKLYGQHLTKEEVEAFVAPSSETTAAVNGFLSANGLTASPISPSGDMLGFSIPVMKANELFAADFSVFTHQATGEQAIRTLSFSIPAALTSHIEFIHPTTAFPVLTGGIPSVTTPIPKGTNITADGAPASCATFVTPGCLQAQYGIPASAPNQAASNIGVSGFIGQFAQKADLKSFLQALRPDLPSTTSFALQSVDGGVNTQGVAFAGIEANLDIQYTVGVAGSVPVTFISVGSTTTDGINGFLDIINFLLEQYSPQVLTTSYGFNEPGIPTSIANSLCNAYMQLGARGVSVLFSSGDGGVSGSQAQTCTTFIPTFPSGCPFLTSVGATTGISPETSASFSSGGFSNLFARPSYQASAVYGYLTKLGSTNAGLFNRSGRGFPDVAAQGENVVILNGGQEVTVSGTSCSSPIFASTIALLNAELIAAGKPVLGFLNPFIYANPRVFTDITTGSNPGCNTTGFPATTGWDPVTGMGSPNYAYLRAALGL